MRRCGSPGRRRRSRRSAFYMSFQDYCRCYSFINQFSSPEGDLGFPRQPEPELPGHLELSGHEPADVRGRRLAAGRSTVERHAEGDGKRPLGRRALDRHDVRIHVQRLQQRGGLRGHRQPGRDARRGSRPPTSPGRMRSRLACTTHARPDAEQRRCSRSTTSSTFRNRVPVALAQAAYPAQPDAAS